MNEIIRELINQIKNKWPRRSTLLLLLLLALLIMLIIFSGIDFQKISLIHIIFIVVVLIALTIFWFLSTLLPKTPKGKIGFGLAIHFETKEQNEKIVSDFVTTLRELMQNGKFKYPYFFIVYSQYHAQKIKTTDDAFEYMNTSRLNYLIWGRARTRQINGQDSNILNLEGMVRHRPIRPEIQKHLSAEFNEIFPRTLIIASENDIFSFEFTAEWMHLVATYIIGIAALISGDISYAQDLFEHLAQKINVIKTDLLAIIKLRQRLPSRLSDVYSIQASFLMIEWGKTKDPSLLIKARSFLDNLKRIDPTNYNAHMIRSIILFVIDKDIPGAKKELEKCRTNHLDITWRYNYAFLLAYEGNLSKAFSEYKRAFRGEVIPQALKEIESFILWILDKEPDKIQLYFLLGLLYFRKLNNPSQALEDLEKFLINAPNNKYGEQRKYAQEQIITLKKLIVESNK